ncbi:type II toxin-antitoxin system YafQ family toxin [Sulfurospirillum cavolei]|uniref:type II toxin-antitoxin system YafQ family toxin n=1 Tax=Sulfurospirillum cavolei TaxID=366522 RepID=UPI000764C233|nr:type II toxin-antitoxin system YafQ family toxin [Sulfurospirillum cavolei]
MKYAIFRTSSFKKAYKKLSSSEQELVLTIVLKLAQGESLDEKYKDHFLIGNYKGCRECHIKPDLLLIYKINNDEVELVLVEVGKHSKLFK